MKNRTIQRLSCAAAMAASMIFSCGNFTAREPMADGMREVAASRGAPVRMETNPVKNRLGRWGDNTKAFAYVRPRMPVIYRVAGPDLLDGPYGKVSINSDATLDARLDRLGQTLSITARHSGGTENCTISTGEMGNVAMVPVEKRDGIRIYLVRISAKGAPLAENGFVRATVLDISFSTSVSVESELINTKERRARVEGLTVDEREALIPEGR